jgi:two-component system NarL family sensor kinase
MVDTSLAAARGGLQETRRALKALRAAPLDDLGLVQALRHLAEESAARAGATLSLALPSRTPALSRQVEHALYRIAQEALANAVHHADARNLTVALTVEGRGVILVVADDGVGFDQDVEETTGHFGLPGMRERARLVGGELRITAEPGKGTRIAFTVRDSLNHDAATK